MIHLTLRITKIRIKINDYARTIATPSTVNYLGVGIIKIIEKLFFLIATVK